MLSQCETAFVVLNINKVWDMRILTSKYFVVCLFLIFNAGCTMPNYQQFANDPRGKMFGYSYPINSKISFSPDGREIVFSMLKNGTSQIYKSSSEGSNLEVLSGRLDDDVAPVFSPDGSLILFSTINDRTEADLCLMDRDGNNRKVITHGPENDFNAVFSSDGAKIYFLRSKWYGHSSPIAQSSWHDSDIFSINIDGTDLQQLTDNNFYWANNLSVHPNGKLFLLRLKEYEQPYSIWTLELGSPDKLEPVQPNLEPFRTIVPFLKNTEINYNELYDPQFSPDGQSILFTWAGHIGDRSHGELFIMNYATKEAQRITNLDGIIQSPSFSQDDKLIAFSYSDELDVMKSTGTIFSERPELQSKLCIINSDGSGLRTIKLSR